MNITKLIRAIKIFFMGSYGKEIMQLTDDLKNLQQEHNRTGRKIQSLETHIYSLVSRRKNR